MTWLLPNRSIVAALPVRAVRTVAEPVFERVPVADDGLSDWQYYYRSPKGIEWLEKTRERRLQIYRDYHRNNREQRLAYKREYYRNNKEKWLKYRKSNDVAAT